MKKAVLTFFSLVCVFLFCPESFSIELNFKHYKVEDGLSSNTVYAILQDSDGFMWFGTENGLNRFDGYHFTIYRNTLRDNNSLINNSVYCIAEDAHKTLWIGTERGVCFFDSAKNHLHRFTAETSDKTSINGRIQNILLENSKIWIASAREGVFMYEDNLLIQHKFDDFIEDNNKSIWINTIYLDTENVLWASVDNTRHQIYKFDRKTAKFIPAFPDMSRDVQKQLRSYGILEGSQGILWFGTWTNGLISVDKTRGTLLGRFLDTPGKNKILHIHHLMQYDDNTILIGSNDGLTSFELSSSQTGNRLKQHFREPALSNRFVYPIYKDRENGLWIGTYHGGINYSSPNRNYFAGYVHTKHENSLTGNVVSSFCEDNHGNIWMGTEDGGLNHFDVETEKFTSYNNNSLSFNNVHSLHLDNDKLWIGTYSGGLNVMDLKTKKIKHYFSDFNNKNSLDANSIYAIFRDTSGTMWIGTNIGVNIYVPQTDNFIRVRNFGETVMDIAQTDNRIWFATLNKGLHTFDTKSQIWTEYHFENENEKSLISNDVICLLVDENDRLWIGTTHGLCRYDAENDCFIDEKVEFKSNYICKILSHNSNLWITTLKGLVCYTPATKTYREFNKSDGLLSDLFTPNSGYRASTGRIYVGTPNGFNAFYPDQLSENTQIPPIAITDFQLFNKTVNLNDYFGVNKHSSPFLNLAYNQNSFSFVFTALSFFAPEKNGYAFMLDGFDKNWNETGTERRATYTNIPPGTYTFRVRASNNDGIWNNEGYALPIVIKPPFWWNVWSISLYIFLVLAFIYYLFLRFLKQSHRKNEERIAKIKSDQEKEAYASKIEFFTNVAHEIRTPLSLIVAPLEKALEKAEKIPDEVRENLNTIESNSERLLVLVNQLLDFSKIEKSGVQVSLSSQNIYLLLFNIYKRFKPSVESRHITFEYIYDSTTFATLTDGENFTKVFSNLLSNASKYAKSRIVLQLQTHPVENFFEVSVMDDGPGIPETETVNIFDPFYQIAGQHKSGTGIGLYLVKTIVQALNGKIEVKNNPNSGFSVSVIFPKTQSEEACDTAKEEIFSETKSYPAVALQRKDDAEADCSGNEKQTLLIVEDNVEMQLFIKNQFSVDYVVYTAKDGNDGISVLENHEVDIIVTDMMMPNMDGIEFCKTVKSNFLWSHIPIIMLTAKTNVSAKVEAFETGADAYLEKPFQMAYLSTRIRNLLENRKLLFRKFTQTPNITLKSIAGNKMDEEFLTRMNDIIEKNIANFDFQVEDLAKELGISSSGLFAKIKQISGTTPNKLIQAMRLKKAAELLAEGRHRVNEVCYRVGFNNPSYFTKCFQKQFGKLPKDFVPDSN